MEPFDPLGEVAVVDCETTGTDPQRDRIVSAAVVLVDLGRDDSHEAPIMEITVNPGVPIPPDATRIHGIRDADVCDLDDFGQVAGELTDFIADRPLVGFNVSFDKQILNAELKRHGFKTFHRKRSYCVMRALEEAWGYRPSLGNALERMQLSGSTNKLHDALNDAVATARIAGILHRTSFSLVEQAPGDRWSGKPDMPPTPRQLEYIRDLGGNPTRIKTRRQASAMIDRLTSDEAAEGTVAFRQKRGRGQRGGCLGVSAFVFLLALLAGIGFLT